MTANQPTQRPDGTLQNTPLISWKATAKPATDLRLALRPGSQGRHIACVPDCNGYLTRQPFGHRLGGRGKQHGHRAVAVPELPLDGGLCELSAAPGTAPTLINPQPRPLNKGTGNPEGMFNFDKKHSTFSLKITYKERDRWKDV